MREEGCYRISVEHAGGFGRTRTKPSSPFFGLCSPTNNRLPFEVAPGGTGNIEEDGANKFRRLVTRGKVDGLLRSPVFVWVGGSLEKIMGRKSQFGGRGASSAQAGRRSRNLYQRTRNREGRASTLMTRHLCPQPPRKLDGIHKTRVRPRDINGPVSWMSRRFFIRHEHHRRNSLHHRGRCCFSGQETSVGGIQIRV